MFETDDKTIILPVRIEEETVWLTQAQMVELFERDQSVISRHITNTFKEEIDKESNMHFLHSDLGIALVDFEERKRLWLQVKNIWNMY